MSISITRYVDITSTVAGASAVDQQRLIGRRFTSNPLLPAGVVITVRNGEAEEIFGFNSPEADFARQYFSYVSPAPASKAQVLQFAPWLETPRSPSITADDNIGLTAIKLITAGRINLEVGSVSYVATSINLSSATDLTHVATLLTSALDAVKGSNPALTVTYDTNDLVFTVTSGGNAPFPITHISYNDATDVGDAIGLSGTNSQAYPGGSAQTPLQAFIASEDVTDNFGSGSFQQAVSLSDAKALSQYVAGQNVKYMILWSVPDAGTAQTWSDELIGIASTGVILNATIGEYKESIVQAILAATNYNYRNASINYMFRQVGLTADVRSNTDADYYDNLRVNYYGQTATAGQNISFLQRGVLMGGATAPTDMSVHANEQWLKAFLRARLMALLLAVNKVPANADGRSMVLAVVQEGIDRALNNGTILTGKELTSNQKVAIISMTGDPLSPHDVETNGYWVDAQINVETIQGVENYQCDYVLVYAKGDSVRKITGSHNLI